MRDYLRFSCVLAAVLCAGASRAAGDADWSECKREDGDRAKIIAACARIAGDKRSPPRDRAIALNNRGNAYQTNKDFGRAIADYDAALRLDPNLAHTISIAPWPLKGRANTPAPSPTPIRRSNWRPPIPSRYADAATSTWPGAKGPKAISTPRSPITRRRSGSIPATRSPIATAASPMRPRATASTPAPITTW